MRTGLDREQIQTGSLSDTSVALQQQQDALRSRLQMLVESVQANDEEFRRQEAGRPRATHTKLVRGPWCIGVAPLAIALWGGTRGVLARSHSKPSLYI